MCLPRHHQAAEDLRQIRPLGHRQLRRRDALQVRVVGSHGFNRSDRSVQINRTWKPIRSRSVYRTLAVATRLMSASGIIFFQAMSIRVS